MHAALLSLALLCGAAQVETAEKPDTLLYIRTTPTGAEVLLDGKLLGKSDGLFPVEAGEYKIVLDLAGHEPEEHSITIRDGRVTRIEIRFKKRPPATPASTSPPTPSDFSSYGDAPAAAVATLEFRVGPFTQPEGLLGITQEEIDRYRSSFRAKGPSREPRPDPTFRWFPLQQGVEGGLITETSENRKWVLLGNRPEEILSIAPGASSQGALQRVELVKDQQARPAIRIEFNDEAARRLEAISRAYVMRPLAVIVEGEVVFAPTIRSVISKSVEITGHFTEAEVNRLVQALWSVAVTPPGETTAPETSRDARPGAVVERLVIDVDKQGSYQVEGKVYDAVTLGIMLRQHALDQPNLLVLLRCSHELPYLPVQAAIDLVRSAGLDNVVLTVRQPAGEAKPPPAAEPSASESQAVLHELCRIVALREQGLEDARKLADRGAASRWDLDKAELELAEARLRLADELEGADHAVRRSVFKLHEGPGENSAVAFELDLQEVSAEDELRKIVAVRRRQLDRVRKLAEQNAASKSEVREAELKLAEASLQLVKRSAFQSAGENPGGSQAQPDSEEH